MNKLNLGFIFDVVVLGSVLVFSVLSYFKLDSMGDGDPILTPLRILNVNVVILSFIVLQLMFKGRNKAVKEA